MPDATFLTVDQKSNLVTLFERAASGLAVTSTIELAATQYCDLQGRPAVYLGNEMFRLYDGTLAKRSGFGEASA